MFSLRLHRWYPSLFGGGGDQGLVEIALALASEASGSGAGNHQRDELDHMLLWLQWRITDGWEPTILPQMEEFDSHLRQMCQAAIALHTSKKQADPDVVTPAYWDKLRIYVREQVPVNTVEDIDLPDPVV